MLLIFTCLIKVYLQNKIEINACLKTRKVNHTLPIHYETFFNMKDTVAFELSEYL